LEEDVVDQSQGSGNSTSNLDDSFRLSAPQLSLPKGGGAIHGIGEKFATNPVTGTGSMSVPIATSPGRSGFGPQLSLSYDSGSGDGPFGIGWSLSLPAITRKTDKGLPSYFDADESDVFILSGAEDLTPAFKLNTDGSLTLDQEPRLGYQIKRYRPRIEGLFARIERWTRLSDNDTHWRSISKDNILTVYGVSAESRIADPDDPTHIFSWLICQSYDDKGNAITYDYVAENSDNVDLTQANERNRTRTANRYLKYVRYGNQQPVLIDPSQPSFRIPHVPVPDFSQAGWMFEVVFDYGEGHYQENPPDNDGRIYANAQLTPPTGGTWSARLDPFSTYRGCFEVRCYRLCQRVLMFHHFAQEFGVADYLVRSTEFNYLQQSTGSFITQAVQSGFKLQPNNSYLKSSLPPVDFVYSTSPLIDLSFNQLPLQEVDANSLRNLPAGIDGSNYRWLDLDGEGIAGVLTEQGNGWLYKANLGKGRFGPVQSVSPRPAMARLNSGRQQLLDVYGDGNLDLVELEAPTPGFYPRGDYGGWENFRTFPFLPNVDWQDPNLRFIDLTGDGHADILITQDQAYSLWHESYAEMGFGPANRMTIPWDEETGPRVVFTDGVQSIYLADMSGDGLTDLVRIRVGEVCYWPNIGYGRFGAKVTMDNAPCFDDLASFEQRRIHLADTDGSGPSDLIYLHRDGVRIFLNQHGNSLSDARLLTRVPRTDNLTDVSVVDFLGHGTACLLWSSPLPGATRQPLRYLDLMGGVKPNLLIKTVNNLGAETLVAYASSTEFYLADKLAGTPWVTRLPFPVQVVARVETRDLISGNRFVSRYSYHHGLYDGLEREFRGFSRVDQWDSEDFGILNAAGQTSSSSNLDPAFNVPPVLTKTWFHTGAFFEGKHISRFLESEYYSEGDPVTGNSPLTPAEFQSMLLDDTLIPPEIPVAEMREAVRSLKGGILRQEIYALDGTAAADRPYSVSERNYTIEYLQPRGENRFAVFFTHARETIDYHYERQLYPVVNGQIVDAATAEQNPATRWLADPRVTHNMVLKVDAYGDVEQSVAIAYGRRFNDMNPVLTDTDRAKQQQLLVTLTNASFTNDVQADDAYHAPMPAETFVYELINFDSEYTAQNPQTVLQPGLTNLYRFTTVSQMLSAANDGAIDLPYEDVSAAGATTSALYRRLIHDQRTRYRSNDLTQLLALQTMEVPALPGESYKLAFTQGLLTNVFQRQTNGAAESLITDPTVLMPISPTINADRGGYVDLDTDGNWWLPSGLTYYAYSSSGAPVTPAQELTEAAAHFFVPRLIINPFNASSFIDYSYDLFPQQTTDALGNVAAALYDYRVLQAKQLTDPNGNQSFAAFDVLGLPVATAVSGKASENLGDSLSNFTDFDADPTLAQLQAFVAAPAAQAAALQNNATTRFVYDLDRYQRCGEPPFAATLARETHVSDLQPNQVSNIQLSFGYSDGFGRVLQSKIQAEAGLAPQRAADQILPSGDTTPGALQLDAGGQPVSGTCDPRWIGKGRTVYNNKGKPVKQYEPFFSSTHLYEPEPDMTDTGVTPILFYDPVLRVVATLHPNQTYEKVLFDAWSQQTWDVNDTVLLDPGTDPDVSMFFSKLPATDYQPNSTWYDQRNSGQLGADEANAAARTATHAGTPTLAFFDSLGRALLTVADNGVDSTGAPQKYPARVDLDIQGNQRVVRDAIVTSDQQGRIVMQYDYDMLGNRIHQDSMEAGERWMLNDAAGKPIRLWDSRGQNFRTEYDALRRPQNHYVLGTTADSDQRTTAAEVLHEKTVYGESQSGGAARNLLTRVYQQYDAAGYVTNAGYDFKGNPLQTTRTLLADYKNLPDWTQTGDSYAGNALFDALNRVVQHVAPHNTSQAGVLINVLQPSYNKSNQLAAINAWLAQTSAPTALLDVTTASDQFVQSVDYNAKGQRLSINLGNGANTTYTYDPYTFRLTSLTTTCGGNSIQALSYVYDPVGNITHIGDAAQQTVYFNNAIVGANNSNVGTTNDYLYDPIYRLIAADGREFFQANGMPIPTDYNETAQFQGIWKPNPAQLSNYSEAYQYDAAGNFSNLTHSQGKLTATGTVTGPTLWQRLYNYSEPSLIIGTVDVSNRLSSTKVGKTSFTNEPYQYNPHGDITSMPHLSQMQWDFKDELLVTMQTEVSPATPNTTAPATYYVYDAGGQRVRKVTEGQNGLLSNERIYLGGFEIYREYDNQTNITLQRETLQVMDDKQRVAMVEVKTVDTEKDPTATKLYRYQFCNHLGSASVEANDKGVVFSYEEYYPYGGTSFQELDSAVKAAAKRYRFTGKERDEENGFNYHGARYYAPWLGRWTACDPTDLSDGTNLFAYSRGNPVAFTDPTGHGAKEQALGASSEKAMKNFDDLVKDLRIQTGLKAHKVERGIGIGGKRDTIPDEQRTIFPAESSLEDDAKQKVNVVREEKARHVASDYNKTTAKRNVTFREGLDQLEHQVEELGAHGESAPDIHGRLTIILHDSDNGVSSTKKLPVFKKEAAAFYAKWVEKAKDATQRALREKLRIVVTTRDRISKSTEALTKAIAKHGPSAETTERLLKAGGKVVKAGKHLVKPIVGVIAVLGWIGTARAATTSVSSAAQGDYMTASTEGGSALADIVESTPTPAGFAVGIARSSYSLGEALNELLPEKAQEAIGGTINEIVNEGGWREIYRHPFGIGM
jgi:RHS repeat-associated protein